MTKLKENGATSGVGVLATIAYDDLGRRSSLTFGNGASQAYSYDPVSRLASLTNDLASTTNDLSQTLAYNPAGQIASTVRTGDAYAWTGHFNENKTGTANGLNQLTQVGAKTLTHDARGNVTAFGTKSFTYSSENLLLTGLGSTTLGYDPAMRLYESVSGGTTLRLAYDGLDRIAEYDGSNALQRRYVHGPNMDEPLVQYEGIGTTDRRFMSSDERGSIISFTDSSGVLLGINKYDEYGNPQANNLGTFGYTGQAWLSGVNLWYYKARDYDPDLGRFLQTDPIDVLGGINLYSYVGNDPVTWIDPLGLKSKLPPVCNEPICVFGDPKNGPTVPQTSGWSYVSGPSVGGSYRDQVKEDLCEAGGDAGSCEADDGELIVVTGTRLAAGPPRGHNRPPLGWMGVLRRGFGWVGLVLSMEGDTCQTCVEPLKFSKSKNPDKWARLMQQRGWTDAQIRNAIASGKSFTAPNKINPLHGATRYVSPSTGQSVVVDNVTGEIIHIGGPGYGY